MKFHSIIKFACMLVAVFLAADSQLKADMEIDGYTDATNDRFSNAGSLIMDGFDLSGIGQNSSGRWATAISRNVVISAAHFPSFGEVTFYETNDPDGATVIRNVVSGMKIGSTDLYVALLDFNLPSSIAHYSFATEPLAGTPGTDPLSVDSAGIYQGLNAYMVGLTQFDRTGIANRPGQTEQAIGRNKISGYSENVPFLSNTDADTLLLERDPNGPDPFVQYEARVVSGDSGGPMFADISGELRLLGTNAFRADPGDFVGITIGSGINYTGNQAAAINSFITLNAVPEPNSFCLLAIGLMLAGYRRRRNN